MTSEELNIWLAGLDIPSKEERLYLVEINDGNEDPGSITVEEADGEFPRTISIFINETEIEGGIRLSYLYYLPEATTYEGQTIPAGWSYIVIDVTEGEGEQTNMTVTPVTEKHTYTFLRTYNVTNIAEEFDALNGECLGMVEGEPAVYHNLTVNVTNGSSDAPAQFEENFPTDFDINPHTGYAYPSTVDVVGTEDYSYESAKGTVTITANSDVTVNATCPARMHLITATVTNGTATGATEIQDTIGTATVTIVPGSGYTLPQTISVSGEGVSYTYDDTTGVVSLSSAGGDVAITATCPETTPGE